MQYFREIVAICLLFFNVILSEENICSEGSNSCVKSNENNDSHGDVNLYSRGECSQNVKR